MQQLEAGGGGSSWGGCTWGLGGYDKHRVSTRKHRVSTHEHGVNMCVHVSARVNMCVHVSARVNTTAGMSLGSPVLCTHLPVSRAPAGGTHRAGAGEGQRADDIRWLQSVAGDIRGRSQAPAGGVIASRRVPDAAQAVVQRALGVGVAEPAQEELVHLPLQDGLQRRHDGRKCAWTDREGNEHADRKSGRTGTAVAEARTRLLLSVASERERPRRGRTTSSQQHREYRGLCHHGAPAHNMADPGGGD